MLSLYKYILIIDNLENQPILKDNSKKIILCNVATPKEALMRHPHTLTH